jgi:hypothetical protein
VIQLRSTAKALTALFLLMLVGASSAAASSKQDTFFEAPRDLTARTATTESRAAAFTDMSSLGVKALRVNLPWADVAPDALSATKPAFDPTDPAAYTWGSYAATIDEAKARGWKVLVSLSAPVPVWATAAKADQVTRPSADEFKLFATAAAKRFGGPTVLWSIWNEPNLPRFLKPQLSSGSVVSGALYRALFVAGKAGIAAGGQTSAPVLFGELAPSGSSNDGRALPLAFLRNALCLSSKYKFTKSCGKLTLSGVALHPYQFTGGAPGKDDVTYKVLPRLTAALDKAAKAGAINAKVPLYLTEFGVQSVPDPLFDLTEQEQLETRARVEHIAYSNKRVKAFSQYLLTDDADTGGFQTGLIFAKDGSHKKSYDGFRLVLDVQPSGKKKVAIFGLVRPATKATTVVIERKTGKKWLTWKKKKTAANGAFSLTDTARKGAAYRYRWSGPDGKLTSPFVKSFKG